MQISFDFWEELCKISLEFRELLLTGSNLWSSMLS